MGDNGNHPLQWMSEELEQLKKVSQYRQLADTVILENGWIGRNGRTMLNLASNDYLGISADLDPAFFSSPDIGPDVDSTKASAHRTGSTASRLIVGNDPLYSAFEDDFARYKGTESALLFSSGYMANLGIISSVVGRNDIVFSDRLNHASIIDGITLSRAEHVRYRHRDMDHLEKLLQKADAKKRKLIVTDSIFSMDGSIAPLEELVELKNRYGAMLMVDEAHSGGIFGAHGVGLLHELGLTGEVDIHMGTFSKAYGCYGAYAAGDRVLKDYLVNKSRSFIFTTALPPMVISAIHASWLKVKDESWRRQALHERAGWFRERLRRSGFNTGMSESQIIPLIVGDNGRTVQFSIELQKAGIAAVAVRPPTVPEGTARIRFTVMSTHQREDLEWALATIEEVGKKLGMI
jgi:8-amino-7-oxononanoate synthase